MKEHIQRELVNELRNIAQEYHAHGCLRELIGDCVDRHLTLDAGWEKALLCSICSRDIGKMGGCGGYQCPHPPARPGW